jgi:hypothetical protein
MLRYHLDDVALCLLAFLLFAFVAVYSAYKTNSRLPEGDPKKRRFHPMSILLAPILLPLSISLAITGFLLTILLYAGFLVIFAVLLLAIRKPFLFALWNKFSTRIAEPLLKMSTHLIRAPFIGEGANEEPVEQKSP